MRGVLARGLVGSTMVLLGGLVVATLPSTNPLLRHQLLAGLRADEAGRIGALAVVLVGLGLVAHAWLILCRHPSVDMARWAAALWSAPLVLAPPLFSRDGWSYAAQGVMVRLGYSPYTTGPAVLRGPIRQAVDPIWRHTPSPYGPLPLWWGDVLAHVTHSSLGLVIGHRLLALAGVAMLGWAVPRLARWAGADPGLATALVVPSPLVLTNGVAGLHNDILMAGLMAAALALTERSWVLASAVAGLAAAVKVPGGLVCVGIVLVSLPAGVALAVRLRRMAGVALVAALTLAGVGDISGLGSGWIHALGVPGTVATVLSATTMVGQMLDLLFRPLGLPSQMFQTVLRDLGSLATVVLAGWIGLRWRTGSPREAVRAVAWVSGVAVVLAASVHLWYLLWPVAFIGALPLRRLGQRLFVGASTLAALVAPLDNSWHGVYLAILGGTALVTVMFGVLMLVPVRRSTALPHGEARLG